MGRPNVQNVLSEIDDALNLINEIEDDSPEAYARGEDFFEDVREKLVPTQEFIQERKYATEAMA